MEVPKQLSEADVETRAPASRAIATTGCVLVAVTVALRFFGRWCLQRRIDAGLGQEAGIYGMDDAFNVAAVVTFFVLIVGVFMAIDRGMGVHVEVVLLEAGVGALSNYAQAVYVCAIFYNTTLGMIKLSVLSLYQRILRGVQSKTLPTVVWIFFGVVACNTTINVLLVIFQCWPVKAAWDVSILPEDKRCINVNAFYLGNGITGLITDIMVYLLSIPIVMPLQMDNKTKLQLLATMLIGGFAVVTSAVRLGFMPALIANPDVTMAMAIPMDWSVAEPAVGILVSSMPAIRAIRFLWRKTEVDSNGSATGHSTLKSRNGGHVQLYDMKKDGKRGTISDAESGRTRNADDNDSEQDLVVRSSGLNGLGQISRTTELEVTFSPK